MSSTALLAFVVALPSLSLPSLYVHCLLFFFFFFQAEDGIRDWSVTGVQTCALPIYRRAVLRRIRRDAAHPPRAVRAAGEPGLGARTPKALLPPVQFRAPGRRHRGRGAPLARPPAFLPPRDGLQVPAPRLGPGDSGPGPARLADLRHPLALERQHLARGAAVPEREEGGAAAPAHGSRRPPRGRLPRRRGVPREH